MKKTMTICIILFCILITTHKSEANEDGVISIRVAEFPPNYFKDPFGKWTGISVELARAIVEASGYKAQFTKLPWSRAILHMKIGRLDYLSNLIKTDERSEYMYWIGPLRQGETTLIVRKDNLSLKANKLEDLVEICQQKGVSFCYQDNVFYTDEFKKRVEEDENYKKCFIKTHIVRDNFKMTSKGIVLGFFESTINVAYYVKNNPEYKDLRIHNYVLREKPVYHGISKKGISKEIYDRLLRGYQTCMKNGTINKILSEWAL